MKCEIADVYNRVNRFPSYNNAILQRFFQCSDIFGESLLFNLSKPWIYKIRVQKKIAC